MSKKKTHEEYVAELAIKNPNTEVVGQYIDAKTPILHHCKIHDVFWNISPSNVSKGKCCQKCRNEKISKSLRKNHQQYVEDLLIYNPNVEVVDEYINSNTPILHRCKIHNRLWIAYPYNVLEGKGCPKCQETKGERYVRQWLESKSIPYIYQKTFSDCRDKNMLPFDFYLPDYNVLIEYDGQQHFEPVDFAGRGETWAKRQLKITQRHDSIKNIYCQFNNIRLLRISYLQDIEEELNSFFSFEYSNIYGLKAN